MSSQTKKQPAVTGRKVLFIGGPEAGNVRRVPESAGEIVKHGDYFYHIHALRLPGDSRVIFFAYDAQKHPFSMLIDMWREYSVTAQIRRDTPGIMQTYQNIDPVK